TRCSTSHSWRGCTCSASCRCSSRCPRRTRRGGGVSQRQGHSAREGKIGPPRPPTLTGAGPGVDGRAAREKQTGNTRGCPCGLAKSGGGDDGERVGRLHQASTNAAVPLGNQPPPGASCRSVPGLQGKRPQTPAVRLCLL